MKKTMLWGALFTLISSQLNAEAAQQAVQAQDTSSTVTTNQANQPPVTAQATPADNQQPGQNPQGTQQSVPAQQTAPVIDCNYKIPAGTKVETSLVLTWSEKATTQAFDFDPTSVDAQMDKLKACFTEQGWISFSSALQKSGNIEAIKSQKLTVSSQMDGQAQLTDTKENQWKLTLPLQVVYQNDKEKVTQLLTVNVTVARKINGDLGISQIIATPRASVTTQPNEAVTNGNANTPANSGTTVNPTVTPANSETTPNAAGQQNPATSTTAPKN